MWQRPFLPLVSVAQIKHTHHLYKQNDFSFDCRRWSIFSCCCSFFSLVNFYSRFNVSWALLARCAFLQIRSVYLFLTFHTFTHSNKQTNKHALAVSLSNLLYHNNEVICFVTLFRLSYMRKVHMDKVRINNILSEMNVFQRFFLSILCERGLPIHHEFVFKYYLGAQSTIFHRLCHSDVVFACFFFLSYLNTHTHTNTHFIKWTLSAAMTAIPFVIFTKFYS